MENETKNIHKLPLCPKCSGPMKLGMAMSGPKIFCKEYHKCGGIIHSPNAQQLALNPNKPVQSVQAIAGEGTLSLESRDDSKKVDISSQVRTCLSSPGEIIVINIFEDNKTKSIRAGDFDKTNKAFIKENRYEPGLISPYSPNNNVMFRPFNNRIGRRTTNHSIGISLAVLDAIKGAEIVVIKLTTTKDDDSKVESILAGKRDQWLTSEYSNLLDKTITNSKNLEMNNLRNDFQKMVPIENLTEVKLDK